MMDELTWDVQVGTLNEEEMLRVVLTFGLCRMSGEETEWVVLRCLVFGLPGV